VVRAPLVAGLMFALMTAALLHRVLSFAPATIDEPYWISSGHLAWQLVKTGAPPHRWAEAFDEAGLGPFGNQNPPVGKVLVGMAADVAGEPGDPMRYRWVWPRSYAYNLAAGNLPPPALLAGVRGMIALLGLGSLVLVYLIAREAAGRARWAPLLAPAILFSDRAFQDSATRVFMDVPLMFLTLTGIWLTLRWIRRGGMGALTGALVFVGLACATKFSAGSLAAATAALVGLVRAPFRKRVLHVLLAAAVPAAVFVAVNPFLWPQPVKGTLALLREWSAIMHGQKADPALAADAVTDRWKAARLVLRNGCVPVRHGPDVVGTPAPWHNALAAALAFAGVGGLALAAFRRGRAPVPGRGRFAAALGLGTAAALAAAGTPKGAVLTAAVLAVGAWRTARRLRTARRFEAPEYLGALFLATLAATVAWLPFDWPRFYLPVFSLSAAFAAWGAMEMEENLSRCAEPDAGAGGTRQR